MVNTKELVPMYELSNKMKETYLSLLLGDILDKIKVRCEEYVQDYFIDKGIGSQFALRNMNCALEYLFSEGLFLLNLVQGGGFEIDDTAKVFIEQYVKYDEQGYKEILGFYVSSYNRYEDRLYTKDELKERNEKINKIAAEIFGSIE